MGNSEWRHFAPFEQNLNAALRRLQAAIFAAGDYYKGYAYSEDKTPDSLEELRHRAHGRTHSILDVDYVVRQPEPEQAQPTVFYAPPSTIAGHLVVYDGLPSIFQDLGWRDNSALPEDVRSVRGYGMYCLTRQQLADMFGTEFPSRNHIADALNNRLFDHLGCVAIVIYGDNMQYAPEPVAQEIYFHGCTGGGP